VNARLVPPLIFGAGLVLTLGIREQHEVQPRAPMSSIPLQLTNYVRTDTIVSDEEQQVAGMSDYAMRLYRRDSSVAFTVYVGYYDRQVQGKSIHSPRNCLPGAGWQIMQSARIPLAGAAGTEGNRVLLANGRARALVYYWYQGRGRIEASEYRVKWDLLRDAALYGRTEESLVRIVIPLDGAQADGLPTKESIDAGDALAAEVTRALVPAVYAAMPAFNRG
jgi:EpsI family protein